MPGPGAQPGTDDNRSVVDTVHATKEIKVRCEDAVKEIWFSPWRETGKTRQITREKPPLGRHHEG